jgi:hypothetical protein
MKLQVNESGYSHLLNDQDQPVYCVGRSPATTIVADKFGQPTAIVLPTDTNYCGDHCPFFCFESQENKTGIVTLCHSHIRGISEIVEPSKKNDLKILKL